MSADLESRIAELNAERLLLERDILEIRMRERQRIGCELHDGLGQRLAAISYLSHRLAGSLAAAGSPDAAQAAEIRTAIEEALALARSLARGLQPAELEAGGLSGALADLARQTTAIFRIPCHFKGPSDEPPLDAATATHLHAIAGEAVTNAVKHAAAAMILLELETGNEGLRLEVRDDGRGMPANTGHVEGSGMRIMKYRADMIGASLDFSSHRPGGTRVVCTLPRIRKPIP